MVCSVYGHSQRDAHIHRKYRHWDAHIHLNIRRHRGAYICMKTRAYRAAEGDYAPLMKMGMEEPSIFY